MGARAHNTAAVSVMTQTDVTYSVDDVVPEAANVRIVAITDMTAASSPTTDSAVAGAEAVHSGGDSQQPPPPMEETAVNESSEETSDPQASERPCTRQRQPRKVWRKM